MNEFTKDLLRVMASVLLGLLSVFLILNFINPGKLSLDVQSTAHPEARTITVSGEGKVVVKPDIAQINVSVISEDKTVSKVITANTDKMNGIIDKIKALGIDEKDMTTSGYNLNPVYNYPENLPPVITGYSLDQTLSLKIRNLDLVDNVIDDATTAGANNVYGLTFKLDDDTEVMNQAREKAFAEAKTKADMMVKAAGVKLGDVYTFSEGYNTPYPTPYYAKTEMAYGMAADVATPNIQSGSQEYSVDVSITYEIK
jgi:uncharacterized protein YggE